MLILLQLYCTIS